MSVSDHKDEPGIKLALWACMCPCTCNIGKDSKSKCKPWHPITTKVGSPVVQLRSDATALRNVAACKKGGVRVRLRLKVSESESGWRVREVYQCVSV